MIWKYTETPQTLSQLLLIPREVQFCFHLTNNHNYFDVCEKPKTLIDCSHQAKVAVSFCLYQNQPYLAKPLIQKDTIVYVYYVCGKTTDT